MLDPERPRRAFLTRYGTEPRIFAAPGRVNLIGEHTDYNDGFVLPIAIDRETMVAAARAEGDVVRAWSATLDESVEVRLGAPAPARRGGFVDYVEGVVRALEASGVEVPACNLAIESDVPTGSGLSSSAALEISLGLAFCSMAGVEMEGTALARAAQRAEHEHVGTMCGLMDQLAAVFGAAGQALLIDCRSLDRSLVPFDRAQVAVVVADTGVKHELAGSEYNRRRAECERAVALLRERLPTARALRDLTPAQLEEHAGVLDDVTLLKRARHVVTENARTLAAAQALSEGDLDELGSLMLASHASLRDDYEVSCAELDALVDIAFGASGVIGARMTGGGFGGCTVSLVEPAHVATFVERLREGMADRFGRPRPIDVFVTSASAGAREVA